MGRRGFLAFLAICITAFLLFAAPAVANHQVIWSAGNNCSGNQRGITVASGQKVEFSICVDLQGRPLPNHQMFYDIDRPDGSQQKAIPIQPTNHQGMTRFEITFDQPGPYRVTLCDQDGCQYQSTIINVTGPPPVTQVSPSPAQSPETVTSPTPEPTLSTTKTKPRSTTTERQTETPVCWWCWGLKLVFVLTLVCFLIHHFIRQEWWSWWFLWFILIFVWIPFWLAWFWFFQPWWWWIAQLIWFPIIAGFGMRWARSAWWRPWMWLPVIGWMAAIASGTWYLGIGRWWLPVIWLPWVGIYLVARGTKQSWWRLWLWLPLGGYALVIFAWFSWLTAWWGWVVPAWAIAVFLGWFLLWRGKSKREWWGPKICFVFSWVGFPWIVFMNTEWDPWWCWIVVLFVWVVLLCVLSHFVRKTSWWVWWALWIIVIFLWLPLLIAIPIFFSIWWWWIPFLLWIPAILLVWWSWMPAQPWWRSWLWLVALAWLAVIGACLIFLQPAWWWMLPVLWVPWVALYVFARAVRQPWWKPWLWLPLVGWGFWVFAWVIWLTPFWWWMFAVLPGLVIFWWVWWTKQTNWRVISEKLCFALPWVWLPFFAFAILVFYYLT